MRPYGRPSTGREPSIGLRPLSPRRSGIPGVLVLVSAVLVGCTTSGGDPGTSLCPGTAAGIPVDADGCPLYSDADAVPDYRDKCPNTQDAIPVDANGCPLDSDVDGVVDGSDACPSTAVGLRVNARGCPLVGERIAIVTNINFDLDRATVRENVEGRLDRVVELLREMPDLDVQILGYTDDIGSAQYNLELSLRRAESVRDYLVARGIDGDRLSVMGRGNTEPLVSNTTPEGRAVNRRVEFVVR